MLGPLPRLYRTLIVAVILVLGVAAGAWVAYTTALPVAASMGAFCGALAAALVAYAVVHDFDHTARPARVARRP